MAGETIRTEAVCLDIRPWSRTSHVVTWLTPDGKLATSVKGAERPKSAFLGQYDLNYTCDILYYARAQGGLHALRDCVPLNMREGLRSDYRSLCLAGYFRRLVSDLAPSGPECASWYGMLSSALDRLVGRSVGRMRNASAVGLLVSFELQALDLAGLKPDFSGYDRQAEWTSFSVETGSFSSDGGRIVRMSRAVAEYLNNPTSRPENSQTPLDAARAIGVFYQFHLDGVSAARRDVLKIISENQGKTEDEH